MGSGVEAGSCSVRWKSFKFAQTTSASIATDYTGDDPELDEALVCREALSKLALLEVVSGVEVFFGKESDHQCQKQTYYGVFHFFKQSLTWAFIKFLSVRSKLYPRLFAL